MAAGEHTIKQYDQELESLRGRTLQMGGLVESQLRMAIDCFEHADLRKADEVVEADEKVDAEEIELARLILNLIVRRQPAANDLRLIMGVSRAVTDLERIGDEATKIARAARWVHEKDVVVRTPRIPTSGSPPRWRCRCCAARWTPLRASMRLRPPKSSARTRGLTSTSA